jgi:hypothetical protein
MDIGAKRLKRKQQKNIELGKLILEDTKCRLNAGPLPE